MSEIARAPTRSPTARAAAAAAATSVSAWPEANCASAAIAEQLVDLVAIFAPAVQFCRHPRQLPAALVDELAPSTSAASAVARPTQRSPLPRLRLVLDGPAARVPGLALRERLPAHPALAADIAWLVKLYRDLLGCPALGLRLEVLERAMCPGWHVDHTGIRLLCSYRGPGTEWLDDRGIDRRRLRTDSAGRPASGAAHSGDLCLLKGSAWQGNQGQGVIHRSPTPTPGSGPRILLALDALWTP